LAPAELAGTAAPAAALLAAAPPAAGFALVGLGGGAFETCGTAAATGARAGCDGAL
jgi:hypothetical protein